MDSKYRFGVIRVKASLMDVDGREMTVYKRLGGGFLEILFHVFSLFLMIYSCGHCIMP